MNTVFLKISQFFTSIKHQLFGIKHQDVFNIRSNNSYWELQACISDSNKVVLYHKPNSNCDENVRIELTQDQLKDLMGLVKILKE